MANYAARFFAGALTDFAIVFFAGVLVARRSTVFDAVFAAGFLVVIFFAGILFSEQVVPMWRWLICSTIKDAHQA